MAKNVHAVVTICVVISLNVALCTEKKGLAMSPALFTCSDLPRLTGISWWYDWAANGDKQRRLNNCTNYDTFLDMHIPMAWGNGSTFPNYNVLPQAKYFLGFNEPNHQNQSNLSPLQAAQLWPQVEEVATLARKLVSPAAAPCGKHCQEQNATVWFQDFFRYCQGCRVDYLATHVYYCDPTKVMDYLYGLYLEFNLEIWVTEFACPGETDPNVVLDFMKAILPLLEEAPYVFRYAWYISRLEVTWMFVKPAVSIFEAGSPSLTTLGKYYNNYGVTTVSTTTTAAETPSSQAVQIQKSVPLILCSVVALLYALKLI